MLVAVLGFAIPVAATRSAPVLATSWEGTDVGAAGDPVVFAGGVLGYDADRGIAGWLRIHTAPRRLPVLAGDGEVAATLALLTGLYGTAGTSPWFPHDYSRPVDPDQLCRSIWSPAGTTKDEFFPEKVDRELHGQASPPFDLPGTRNREPALFQGLWTDPVTGLSYARNRWYDARSASWLSEDPMGALDSVNLYAFALLAPHSWKDPLGLSGLLDNPNWHHTLPIAVFESRGNGAPPFISELGLKLSDEVDIHSAEYGRIVDRPEHTGPGSAHKRYNRQWEQVLAEWKRENPGKTVLEKADLDQILRDLPEPMQEFNAKGVRSKVHYREWRKANLKIQEIRRARSRMGLLADADGDTGSPRGRGLKIRAMAWFQVAVEVVSVASGELDAKRYRDELRARYVASGYSESEIEELIELRKQLEYRALEEISWPLQYPNPDYNSGLEEYLRTIPDGVILPEDDVEALKSILDPAVRTGA